jgi:hypothetical protein
MSYHDFLEQAEHHDATGVLIEPKPKNLVAATLTIHKAQNMTPEGRKVLAKWLRGQAHDLIKDGDNYDPNFKARYEFPA